MNKHRISFIVAAALAVTSCTKETTNDASDADKKKIAELESQLKQGRSALANSADTSSKELTPAKAQRAIDQIIKPGSSGVVTGVASQQVMGLTMVDLTLTNFIYRDSETERDKTYSGRAQAMFKGYTDGRWVMENLVLPGGPETYGSDIIFTYKIVVQ